MIKLLTIFMFICSMFIFSSSVYAARKPVQMAQYTCQKCGYWVKQGAGVKPPSQFGCQRPSGTLHQFNRRPYNQ